MASGRYGSGSASMVGCQNSEEETLPCTNNTAGPGRSATDSTATVSRLVGIRSAVMPDSSVSIVPPRAHAAAAASPGYYGLTWVAGLTGLMCGA